MLFFRIISAASMVEKERSRRLGTSILNQVVQEAVAFKPPPRTRGGKRGRVYFSTQVNFLHCNICHIKFAFFNMYNQKVYSLQHILTFLSSADCAILHLVQIYVFIIMNAMEKVVITIYLIIFYS